MEHRWNEIHRENRSTRGKTCPIATLSTTNPIWTDPASNPGLRGGRPAANSLSHGTAEIRVLILCISLYLRLPDDGDLELKYVYLYPVILLFAYFGVYKW
jgi:hypothetical protein